MRSKNSFSAAKSIFRWVIFVTLFAGVSRLSPLQTQAAKFKVGCTRFTGRTAPSPSACSSGTVPETCMARLPTAGVAAVCASALFRAAVPRSN